MRLAREILVTLGVLAAQSCTSSPTLATRGDCKQYTSAQQTEWRHRINSIVADVSISLIGFHEPTGCIELGFSPGANLRTIAAALDRLRIPADAVSILGIGTLVEQAAR